MFLKKQEKYIVIKVYILDEEQKSINRQQLVDSILAFFEGFLEVPQDYDIGGPYGIRKGGACSLELFRSKLQSKGHDKYYAVSGVTDDRLGFEFLFDAPFREHRYSELIVWFNPKFFELSFEMLIHKLLLSCNISYAYQLELDKRFSIRNETKIKKSILGGISVSSSHEHLSWIEGIENGAIRKIYEWNFINSIQLEKLIEVRADINPIAIKGMYLVKCTSQ